MKTLDFWFDPVSPYAYLAFERLPEALAGFSYSVNYRPILFAALLKHWSHKGPAEIEPKRAWTFRHVAWLAQHHGIELQTPAATASWPVERCSGPRMGERATLAPNAATLPRDASSAAFSKARMRAIMR